MAEGPFHMHARMELHAAIMRHVPGRGVRVRVRFRVRFRFF